MSEMSAWLGQRCHYFDEIYRGLGNILMQCCYCSENSTIARTTLRGLKLCLVF
jgi:hypothetical protein